MSITCVIRYQIEPTKQAEFAQYARTWGQCIPECGAELVGYFGPHEGSATTAYGIYHLPNLAHYEAYRARLREHPLGRDNFAFAQQEKFIRREDRLFLKLVSAPHTEKVQR